MSTFTLTHQQQPTSDSCTQTCLAMVLGVPVADVMKVYPDPMGQYELVMALHESKVLFNCISFGWLVFDGVYLMCVPSLNFAGRNHEIVVALQDGKVTVFDPNQGKEGKLYYTTENLKSWTEMIHVIPCGRLKP